jgi:hypothetical protein
MILLDDATPKPDGFFGKDRVAMRLKSFNLLNALSMRQRSL